MALRPNNPKNIPAVPATRDEAQQEGFLREVDEALRQDQALSLFKRYGKLLAAALVAGLLALAGYLYWHSAREQSRAEQSEKFVLALDKLQGQDLDTTAKSLLPLTTQGEAGSQAAARMLQAGIAVEQGKTEAAAKIFAQIAASADAPQPFRDLAKLREISLRFDAMPADQVVAALKDLAVPGNPWFGSAGELVALAYMKQGKDNLAGPLFAAISRDKTVPDSIRQRSRQMAGLLGVDAVDNVNEAAADTAPAGGPDGL